MTDLPSSRGAIRLVLAVALAVAVLDGLYVVSVFDWALGATNARRLFQGIALALIGREAALSGGWGTATLGMVLHFTVALGWTAVWFVACAQSAALRRLVRSVPGALLAGVLYGVIVHAAMQLVVLPLTHARVAPLLSRGSLLVLLAHVLVIGPPIVLLTRAAFVAAVRPGVAAAPRARSGTSG